VTGTYIKPMRGALQVVCTLLVVVALGACGAEQEVPYPAWKAEFDRALARDDLSDFQRTVLEDYDVSDAEYDEARQGFSGCMTDAGFDVKLNPDGGYTVEDPSITWDSNDDERGDATARFETVHDQCSAQFLDQLSVLYIAITGNPEKRDMDEMIVECLVRNNVVAEGFTKEEYRAASDAGQPLTTDPWKEAVVRGCMVTPARY